MRVANEVSSESVYSRLFAGFVRLHWRVVVPLGSSRRDQPGSRT